MPKTKYKIIRGPRGKRFQKIVPGKGARFIKEAEYRRGRGLGPKTKTTKSSPRTSRRKIMPKKRSYRRRGNGSSYSKTNIAIGSTLGAIAPKLAPGWTAFMPLLSVIPKVPTALKVAGWTIASKQLSDKYLGGTE